MLELFRPLCIFNFLLSILATVLKCLYLFIFILKGFLQIEDAATRPYVTHYKGQLIQSLCIGHSARACQGTRRTQELENLYKVLNKWLRQDWHRRRRQRDAYQAEEVLWLSTQH